MTQGGNNRRRFVTLGLVLALLGVSCGDKKDPVVTPTSSPVTLTLWEVYDSPEVFDKMLERYKELRPNITVQVLEKNYPDYELEVANAIAAGIGPDVWTIRNDWLPKHADKLQAMPDTLLPKAYPDVAGSDNKDATNADVIQAIYPDAVASDAIFDSKVYGIPLAIDTLALYYNKDHFREAGLTLPPATWNEFIADVQKLTQYEDAERTRITRAGAAIGTAKNINRASDILTALMLQNNTQMVSDDKKSVLMNGAVLKDSGGLVYPGAAALEFYTGFADPKKAAYTWNNELPNSIDAFVYGQTSMFFSYAYMQRTLLNRAPALNYGVAPLPQVDNTPTPVDYPTYWLNVVSRNTKHAAEAWDFMKFMSQEGDSLYQEATAKPPAKRSQLAAAADGTEVGEGAIPRANERVLAVGAQGPWVFQTSTAKSWYRGKNPGRIEQLLLESIDNVVIFGQPPQVAIDNAAAQMTRVFQQSKS